MGKHWAKYAIGRYRLGSVKGRATANWIENGKQRRSYLDAYDEKSGRTALNEFIIQAEKSKANPDIKGRQLYELYRADRVEDGIDPKNIDNSWKALSPTFAKSIVRLINNKQCRDYARNRFDLGMASATVHTELLQLRTFVNWGVKQKVFTEEFAPYIWLPRKGQSRQRELSSDEIGLFLNNAELPHLKLFFIIALSTGARSTALLELTWDRVDFEKGTINLLRPENIDKMKKVARKNRAVVGMNMVVRVALQEAYENRTCDYVIEWNSRKLKRISKSFKACCDRAGLKNVHPHIIRHTCATFNLEQGVPLEVVSKLLGHSNTEITLKIYAHATPKLLAQATSRIDGLINKDFSHELEAVNFIEYIVMKYQIEPSDAQKLREIEEKSTHYTILEGSLNKKTEATIK